MMMMGLFADVETFNGDTSATEIGVWITHTGQCA